MRIFFWVEWFFFLFNLMKKNMYRHKCTKLLLHVVGINKMIFFLSSLIYQSNG